LNVNKRLIVVGMFLGTAITIAFFIGCPNLEIGCYGFDTSR